ncbi:ElaB/YqjD/DUF883 family membrane-anchored ribosome-binding protein [Ereboglobus sp. PH5-5]|uniref:hypothetical protein n=1 Tax=unclassified Ereboglobus TaxID=2626932 RepID=UPI0024051CB6|nr:MULTISPECIES: hypothetical protein [unclassified Ereboglobus]MDF9826568.1 ElaB/YqjD/DUF883 family membrane-anchored ribosome-binding protein [Ereboglobus sp. PH5-10]MDF9832758.1 ElaB/YqjD/DUF883 family membrane-anchored ribosome-binding protein [Ereboglobus sp. PH5-5]
MSKLPSQLSASTNAAAWKKIKTENKLPAKADCGLEAALDELDDGLKAFKPSLVQHGYTVFAAALGSLGGTSDDVVTAAKKVLKHPSLPAPAAGFAKKIIVVAQAIAGAVIDEKIALKQEISQGEKAYKTFFEIRSRALKLLTAAQARFKKNVELLKQRAAAFTKITTDIKAKKIKQSEYDSKLSLMEKILGETKTLVATEQSYYDGTVFPEFKYQREGGRQKVRTDAGVNPNDKALVTRIIQKDTGIFENLSNIHLELVSMLKQMDTLASGMTDSRKAAEAAIMVNLTLEKGALKDVRASILNGAAAIEQLSKEAESLVKKLDGKRLLGLIKEQIKNPEGKTPDAVLKWMDGTVETVDQIFDEPIANTALALEKLDQATRIYNKTLLEIPRVAPKDVEPQTKKLAEIYKTSLTLRKKIQTDLVATKNYKKQAEDAAKKAYQAAAKKVKK